MWRRELPAGEGLCIQDCGSIHMFFMRFAAGRRLRGRRGPDPARLPHHPALADLPHRLRVQGRPRAARGHPAQASASTGARSSSWSEGACASPSSPVTTSRPMTRAYAEAKLRRLERHASLDDVGLTVERATPLLPRRVGRDRPSRPPHPAGRPLRGGQRSRGDRWRHRQGGRAGPPPPRPGHRPQGADPGRRRAAPPLSRRPAPRRASGPPASASVRSPAMRVERGRPAGTIQLGTAPPGPIGAVTGAPRRVIMEARRPCSEPRGPARKVSCPCSARCSVIPTSGRSTAT